MGDEDEGLALRLQLTHGLEERLLGILIKGRCRLVHDDDLGIAVQHFQYLDQLAFGDGQIADAALRLQVNAEAVAEFLIAREMRRPIDPAQRSRFFASQIDIGQHGQRGHQRQILIDDADALSDGISRRFDIS